MLKLVRNYFNEQVQIRVERELEVLPPAAKFPRLTDFGENDEVSPVSTWKEQLDYFLHSPLLAIESDPVSFWFNNTNFDDSPEFRNAVLEILSCPCSSTSVERLFSLCGLRTSNRTGETDEGRNS